MSSVCHKSETRTRNKKDCNDDSGVLLKSHDSANVGLSCFDDFVPDKIPLKYFKC